MKSTTIACFIVWLVTVTSIYLFSSWYDFNQRVLNPCTPEIETNTEQLESYSVGV